jgi:3-hydroxyacyl-[acyl-carrier-protein] dehydratase
VLQKHFYNITETQRDGNTASVKVAINPHHGVFAGHFPQQAVVPGVFSLQMLKECLEMLIGSRLQYTELINCKFSQAILPSEGQILNLQFDYIVENENVSLKAAVKENDSVKLSLKAKLKIIT